MQAMSSSETQVTSYKITQSHNREDRNGHLQLHDQMATARSHGLSSMVDPYIGFRSAAAVSASDPEGLAPLVKDLQCLCVT